VPTTITFNATGELVGGGAAPLVGVPAVLDFSNGTASVEAAQLIPLQPVPNQVVSVTLGGQACTFRVYGKQIFVPYQPPGSIITQPPAYALDLPVFIEVYVNDALLIGSTLCPNAVTVVRNGYWGFAGDVAFLDTQGSEDPITSGLGSRWVLGYWPGLTT
jgi:hypothetical protein